MNFPIAVPICTWRFPHFGEFGGFAGGLPCGPLVLGDWGDIAVFDLIFDADLTLTTFDEGFGGSGFGFTSADGPFGKVFAAATGWFTPVGRGNTGVAMAEGVTLALVGKLSHDWLLEFVEKDGFGETEDRAPQLGCPLVWTVSALEGRAPLTSDALD